MPRIRYARGYSLSNSRPATRATAFVELLQTTREESVTHSDEEKALLVKRLASNDTVKGGTIVASMRSPFDLLSEGLENGDWWSLPRDLRTRVGASRPRRADTTIAISVSSDEGVHAQSEPGKFDPAQPSLG